MLSAISSNQNENEIITDLWDFAQPASQESVVDWVENNVEIPTGAITGRVSMRHMPYGKEILDRFGNKETKHLILDFATQLGKTSLLIFGMLYKIARDANDAMWVMGNTDQARAFNKERFMPHVRLCKPVMDLVPKTAKGVVDRHLWGFANQAYSSMVLNFVGAGSPTNLASRPRGVIFQDEVDKYHDQMGFDSGTIQLVEERLKTFPFPLSVKASSPTTKERMIYQEFMKSDQREFFVPCPRCEKEILFKMRIKSEKHGDCGIRWWHETPDEAKTDGRWDYKKVRANAFYKCQCCGGMIHSFERPDMLENGIWRPQNPNAEEGRFGYHLSSIYSVLGAGTNFDGIAVKFLLAQGVPSELQNFINGWLAEPWDEAQSYEFKDVKIEVFEPKEIPVDETTLPLMAIDVQQKGYWAVVRRFQKATAEHPFGQSWLLFADFVETADDLDEIQKLYGVKGEHVTADMAHRPTQVAKLIVDHDWRGIWGSDTRKFYHPQPNNTRLERIYSVVQFRDPLIGTSWENRTTMRARYILFSKQGALDLVSSMRYSEPTIWHCTVNVHPEYAAHMNSRVKRRQVNKRTGRTEWIWVDLGSKPNHLFDCENHVAVSALMNGFLTPPPETDQSNVQY